MNIEGIDKLDNQILETIKDNARLSYSEIGEKVSISRVAVKNRMRALEEKGVIKGYQTVIDEKMAFEDYIEFVIHAEIDPEHFDEVLNDLGKEEYIRKIMIISGRSLVQMSGYARNTKTLSNYVDTLYYRMRGIKAITWHAVLSTLKDVDGGVEYVRREKVSEN